MQLIPQILNLLFKKGAAASTSSSNLVKTTTTNNNITLGIPFYIEYDKITSRVPVLLNGGAHAIEVTFQVMEL